MEVPEGTNMENDLAPDADEPGDTLPEELSDLVTEDHSKIVPDEVDQPPNPEEENA